MKTDYNSPKKWYQNGRKLCKKNNTCFKPRQKPAAIAFLKRIYRRDYVGESSHDNVKQPHSGGVRDD